jgi:CRP/FNR family transcriptional regulator, anaerobic regulatory protein
VGFALPADFFGLSICDRYTYSVDAISHVAVCQFLRVPFLRFLRANQQSLYWMFEAALRETNAARDHMLLLGRGSTAETSNPARPGGQPPERDDFSSFGRRSLNESFIL